MTDEQLIEKGRTLVVKIQHAQLELGLLALEYAPIGDAAVKTGAYERLREYAEAVGIDEGTLRNYRAIAHAWKGQDHEGIGFSTLKALTPVAHKDEAVKLLRTTEPPTKSGRWTAPAAVEAVRDAGLWSHSDAPRGAQDVLTTLRRTRGALARVDPRSLTDEARADLMSALDEVQQEVLTLRERLTGQRVG